MSYTRRGVLRGAAGVAAASMTVGTVAAQQEYEHWQAQPDHVSLTYSEDTLLQYAPRLIFEQQARDKFNGLTGWTATSPEYDLDWHVYLAQYSHQSGLSSGGLFVPSDSHLGDHEWYYVASDSKTGETDRVVYDAYHWLAGKLRTSDITMDDTHPVAKVVSPWHPYRHFDIDEDQAVAIESITDLTDTFDGILANGLAESLQPGTVVDPARMNLGGRSHWWRNDVGDFSFDAFYAKVLYDLEFGGADSADSGALEI